MHELIDSDSLPTAYRASAFCLGAGAGVAMPPTHAVNIGINVGQVAGFVIDLHEFGDLDASNVIRSAVPSFGPVIEDGEVVEDGDA